MRYRIAINRYALEGKLPPGDKRWGPFTKSFENHELEVMEIANAIYTGHAYCPWQKGEGRSNENFHSAQFVAVDFDTGDERSRMATLERHPLVQMYGGLIHTTPSHTEAAPRARVLFFLDKPICDPEGYRQAVIFWMSQFDGVDPVCKDPSRFFYGAKNCDIWFSENVLPVAHLRHYYRAHGKPQQPSRPENREKIIRLDEYRESAGRPAPEEADLVEKLVAPMRDAREGTRNSTLFRQACYATRDAARGLVNLDQVASQLLRAAVQNGLPEQEAKRTLANGIRTGQQSAAGS